MDKQGILNCLSEFPIKRVEFEKMRTLRVSGRWWRQKNLTVMNYLVVFSA